MLIFAFQYRRLLSYLNYLAGSPCFFFPRFFLTLSFFPVFGYELQNWQIVKIFSHTEKK